MWPLNSISLNFSQIGHPNLLKKIVEMASPDSDASLYEVVTEVDLVHFYQDIINKLQITRLEHFDHVKEADLKSIGMSQPAIRRLIKAVKDRRAASKKLTVGKKSGKAISPNVDPLTFETALCVSSPTCLIAREDIKLMENLGEGSFGVVKRAIWNQCFGKKIDVAVKLLRSGGEGVADDIVSEINSMHKLKHPHLIRLYGLVVSKPLMMVVELCSGGSLLDRLRHSLKPVPLISQLVDYARQVVDGMAYLEANNFIHRDLATRNILLADENERLVKIGDFGLMRTLQSKDDHYVMGEKKKVPFAWCPPEALKQRKFSHASDVWSYGVTLWEMFSFGEEPWCGFSGPEILEKVSGGELLCKPDACPSPVFNLMRQCWSLEPAQRPTFSALRELLKTLEIQIGAAKEAQVVEGLMEISQGDQILVLDGSPDVYYWTGQNMKTRKVGKFPRKVIALDGKVSQKDIGKPIKGSFVHTGHGDAKGGQSWGQPDKIDE